MVANLQTTISIDNCSKLKQLTCNSPYKFIRLDKILNDYILR